MPISQSHLSSDDRIALMAIRRRLIRIQDDALLMRRATGCGRNTAPTSRACS
jgi:hypothetical protein